ncbi:hypothetical protein [Solirubrum puertoriconensis]|uniref:Uncharacterized protein n=1 Tax=Solirubrum puertoriconensis TaxID=1751427 RepID=A0A9X0HJ75_SOLP1|nr:hypothetical protein [Solirubrum puertoriconensis]KUG06887.1 hypothetical protein ASU33_06060 [Solirubrum puertoriconensis]
MNPDTVAANKLLTAAIGNAAVESYGFSHQVLILEFRDDEPADHLLSLGEIEVTSNIVVGEGLSLGREEKILLLFSKVNLRLVTEVHCDDEANLTISFDNGVQMLFSGRSLDGYEPWQLGKSLNEGGYLIIAQDGGGYVIWDNSQHETP